MCSARCWLVTAAVLGGLAVVTGAFAAHGLDDFLLRKYADQTRTVTGETIPAAVKYLADFRTAAEYQMYHALALLAVGLLALHRPCRSLTVAGYGFVIGIVLFSGSLYALVLTGVTKLGMVTPFGGVAFLVGWGALAKATCQCGSRPEVVELGTSTTAAASK
jgi:uncharacterized membrane protein YgdD (TMEM256/DUF423 family)